MNNRPDWDQYFLGLAFVIASRSRDNETKHGALIVDKKNIPLSFGYNGALSGIDDTKISFHRPNKYPYIIHAESNAILGCRILPKFLGGATIYITGRPCVTCLNQCIQCGIDRFVLGDRKSAMNEGEENEKIHQFLLDQTGVTIQSLELDPAWIIESLK